MVTTVPPLSDQIAGMGTSDAKLLERFVATFDRLDDLSLSHFEPPLLPELTYTIDPDDWNTVRWQPAAISTDEDALSAIHDRIGGVLPRLYEQLVLSYRWLEVDLQVCRLLANHPASDLQPLFDEMYCDPVMNHTLEPANFVRFALAPDVCYDPICFDVNRFSNNDCPIVRLNHELILCNDELGDIQQLFPSFRDLIFAVLEIAD
jgi:hypothetical protein